jgi:hypothetical protein
MVTCPFWVTLGMEAPPTVLHQVLLTGPDLSTG